MVLVKQHDSEKQGVPLRPKEQQETPSVEIHPFDSHDGLIVKIQPPRDHPNPTLDHVPCDIVLVIDVSGSMSTDAPVPGNGNEKLGLSVLDLTKHAARTILETLGEEDRLGIVTFGSEAHVVQKLIPMSTPNKAKAKRNITRMALGGRTNLWHGLLSGIQLFREDSSPNSGRVPAIMILTDGQPNHMCPPQGYVPKLRAMEQLPATIHTFGFGYDLRSGLLKSIAEVSGGNYAFIPDAGMIGTVFVHAVANLQSTFANNATLRLMYPNYLQLEETTGESVNQRAPIQFGEDEDFHRQLSISLGNIQYGQSRDIYLRYSNLDHLHKILALMKEDEELGYPPIINAVLEYSCMDGIVLTSISHRNLLDTRAPTLEPAEKSYHISRSAIIKLLSRVAPIRKKDGEHVPINEERLGVLANDAEALQTAQSESFLPAAQLDPRCHSLLQDLVGETAAEQGSLDPSASGGQITIALQKEHFKRWGIHYLPSLANAHAKQICNSFKDPGPLMYGTGSPLFNRCRDRLDAAFDTLPAPKPSNHTTHRGLVSMSQYNRSSSTCFAGNATVVMVVPGSAERKATRIGRLRAGMSVLTPRGPRRVVAVLKTIVRRETMCLVGKDLMVTPWHPISLTGQGWAFPVEMSHRAVRYTGSIYSVLLQRDSDVDAHAIMVGGVWGVTLGHGLTSSEDVRAHGFLGDYDAVLKGLSLLRKANNGVIISGGIVRDKRTGLMSGFRRAVVPALRKSAAPRRKTVYA